MKKEGHAIPPNSYTQNYAKADLGDYRTVEQSINEERGGLLILTNRRLVWIDRIGFFRKKYNCSLEIPVDSIRGISWQAGRRNVSITDYRGDWTFSLKDILNSQVFAEFKQAIEASSSSQASERSGFDVTSTKE